MECCEKRCVPRGITCRTLCFSSSAALICARSTWNTSQPKHDKVTWSNFQNTSSWRSLYCNAYEKPPQCELQSPFLAPEKWQEMSANPKAGLQGFTKEGNPMDPNQRHLSGFTGFHTPPCWFAAAASGSPGCTWRFTIIGQKPQICSQCLGCVDTKFSLTKSGNSQTFGQPKFCFLDSWAQVLCLLRQLLLQALDLKKFQHHHHPGCCFISYPKLLKNHEFKLSSGKPCHRLKNPPKKDVLAENTYHLSNFLKPFGNAGFPISNQLCFFAGYVGKSEIHSMVIQSFMFRVQFQIPDHQIVIPLSTKMEPYQTYLGHTNFILAKIRKKKSWHLQFQDIMQHQGFFLILHHFGDCTCVDRRTTNHLPRPKKTAPTRSPKKNCWEKSCGKAAWWMCPFSEHSTIHDCILELQLFHRRFHALQGASSKQEQILLSLSLQRFPVFPFGKENSVRRPQGLVTNPNNSLSRATRKWPKNCSVWSF